MTKTRKQVDKGSSCFGLWSIKLSRSWKDLFPFPFWVSLLNSYALVHVWKITKITCLSLHPFFFHKTIHLQNHNQLEFTKKHPFDPIKYHGITTRRGGAPCHPPRPPLVCQSKYFSLFLFFQIRIPVKILQ